MNESINLANNHAYGKTREVTKHEYMNGNKMDMIYRRGRGKAGEADNGLVPRHTICPQHHFRPASALTPTFAMATARSVRIMSYYGRVKCTVNMPKSITPFGYKAWL